MESAHAEAACLLIEAGADRSRVGLTRNPVCPRSSYSPSIGEYRWSSTRRIGRCWRSRTTESQTICNRPMREAVACWWQVLIKKFVKRYQWDSGANVRDVHISFLFKISGHAIGVHLPVVRRSLLRRGREAIGNFSRARCCRIRSHDKGAEMGEIVQAVK